jgi:uncharacterized protein YqeY
MLRQGFADRLKAAMKARDAPTISTVRMIIAGLKDRDIAARTEGNAEGLSDAEISRMLQTMIKQRRESIALYEQGNRTDLAQKERGEITIIEGFLPASSTRDRSRRQQKAAITETRQRLPKISGRSWQCCANATPASLTSGRPL